MELIEFAINQETLQKVLIGFHKIFAYFLEKPNIQMRDTGLSEVCDLNKRAIDATISGRFLFISEHTKKTINLAKGQVSIKLRDNWLYPKIKWL